MHIELNEFDFELQSRRMTRKHVPREANSFYRCIAEKVHYSQVDHLLVRKELIEFATEHPFFEKLLPLLQDTDSSADDLFPALASECYDRPIIVFSPSPDGVIHSVFQVESKTKNARKPISLAATEFGNRLHYDLVLTDQELVMLSMAQCKSSPAFQLFSLRQ